ncbi:MAG: hypothetical protein H6707_21765 [Deltaproteobacteria bacterium]|nr:hypothetical protein [Deltaproteobacteria bacterium]
MGSGYLLFLGWLAAFGPLPEWTPAKTPFTQVGFRQIDFRDGIRVYKDKTSRIVRIAAEGYIPVAAEHLQRALLDYRAHVGAMARVHTANILWHRPDNSQLIVYQRLALPAASDRDFVLHVISGKRDHVLYVAYKVAANVGPPPARGVVRVRHHSGSWQLHPTKDGKRTWVRYQVSIDVGGWIPRWLARSGAGEDLPELFEALCRLSRGGKGKGHCLRDPPH